MRELGSVGRALVAACAIAVGAFSEAACSSFTEPAYWHFGFRNDSDRILIMQEQGWSGDTPVLGGIMPAHAHAGADYAYVQEGRTLPMAVFDTDCGPVGSVTLTEKSPYAYIDSAGHVSAAESQITNRASPATAALQGHDLKLAVGVACGFKGLQVDIRNDSDMDVLVRLIQGASFELRRVPANSRGSLDGTSEAGRSEATVELLHGDCSSVGTVALSQARSVVYIDPAGDLSAQPQSVFWEEPPPAHFRYVAQPDATQCPLSASASVSASP